MTKRVLLCIAMLCLFIAVSLAPLIGQDVKKRAKDQACCGTQQEPSVEKPQRVTFVSLEDDDDKNDKDDRKGERPTDSGIVCPRYPVGNGLYYCWECSAAGNCPLCVSKPHPFPNGTPSGNCLTGVGCDPLAKFAKTLQAAVDPLPTLPDSTWEPIWVPGTHVLTRQVIDFKSPDGHKMIRAKIFALFLDPREDGNPLQPIFIFTGGEIKKVAHEQPHYVITSPADPGGPYMCNVNVGSASFMVRTRTKLE